MMKHVRRWIRDQRGTSFEGIALSVSIIAVGFVASADVLDYVTRKHGPEIGAAVHDVATAVVPSMTVNQDLDYSTTGSLPATFKQPIVLDPCTGTRK